MVILPSLWVYNTNRLSETSSCIVRTSSESLLYICLPNKLSTTIWHSRSLFLTTGIFKMISAVLVYFASSLKQLSETLHQQDIQLLIQAATLRGLFWCYDRRQSSIRRSTHWEDNWIKGIITFSAFDFLMIFFFSSRHGPQNVGRRYLSRNTKNSYDCCVAT